jgi:hypothetical protein
MPASQNAVGPADLTSGRLRVAIDKDIHKLNIDKTPLLKILDKAGKEGVKRMTYNWLTKERRADWAEIASFGGAWAAGANKAGTIVVAAGDAWMFGPGDIIQCPTDSAVNIYVDSVSTVTLTCHTYDDSTTIDFSAGTVGANTLLQISNTFELGSNRGTMKSHQPGTNSNYIQILQDPYGVVETLQHLEYDAGGREWTELEQETIIQHEFKKEKSFFFGQKHKATTGYMDGTYEQYFTGGLLEAITTNATAETVLTQAEFGAWVNGAIYYAKNPVIFCGETIFEALSWWLGNKLQTRQDEKTLGISVANYLTEYGDPVMLIPHRELLKNQYSGYAFAVDLADIKYMYLDGLDTHLEVGIQTPGQKQEINEYRSWFGCWVGNEKRHGVLTGVTSIAA